MLMDERIMNEFEQEAKKLRQALDSLSIPDEKRKQLIEQMNKTYDRYDSALKYADSLPAARECYLYAQDEVHDLKKKYL